MAIYDEPRVSTYTGLSRPIYGKDLELVWERESGVVTLTLSSCPWLC